MLNLRGCTAKSLADLVQWICDTVSDATFSANLKGVFIHKRQHSLCSTEGLNIKIIVDGIIKTLFFYIDKGDQPKAAVSECGSISENKFKILNKCWYKCFRIILKKVTSYANANKGELFLSGTIGKLNPTKEEALLVISDALMGSFNTSRNLSTSTDAQPFQLKSITKMITQSTSALPFNTTFNMINWTETLLPTITEATQTSENATQHDEGMSTRMMAAVVVAGTVLGTVVVLSAFTGVKYLFKKLRPDTSLSNTQTQGLTEEHKMLKPEPRTVE